MTNDLMNGLTNDLANDSTNVAIERFVRVCEDGFAMGWHEANGGNLSYRLTPNEVAQFGLVNVASNDAEPSNTASNGVDPSVAPSNTDSGTNAQPWIPLPEPLEHIASSFFLVTASGAYLHGLKDSLSQSCGIIETDPQGASWRIAWGFEGARPTSELSTHLTCHNVRMEHDGGTNRVIYHAHCPNVVALSTVIEPDSLTWTRAFWGSMTECVVMCPEGLGVVPWTVPGGHKIAKATARLMRDHKAIVWQQHGVVVAGDSLESAFGLMHTVEKTAGIYLSARAACGGAEPPRLVSAEQVGLICATYGLKANPTYLRAL